MNFYGKRCEYCDDFHEPGPCYPTDEERVRGEGWRLYRAVRTQLFPDTTPPKEHT